MLSRTRCLAHGIERLQRNHLEDETSKSIARLTLVTNKLNANCDPSFIQLSDIKKNHHQKFLSRWLNQFSDIGDGGKVPAMVTPFTYARLLARSTLGKSSEDSDKRPKS